jgi:hypothetical protein
MAARIDETVAAKQVSHLKVAGGAGEQKPEFPRVIVAVYWPDCTDYVRHRDTGGPVLAGGAPETALVLTVGS